MPTSGRRELAIRAIDRWLSQSYVNKELIVVDDPIDSIFSKNCQLNFPGGTLRYYRTTSVATIGWKMNIGARLARGQLISKMDDDDIYCENFLSSMQRLLELTGYSLAFAESAYFYLRKERQVVFSGTGWRFGASLFFCRSLWERQPFRDTSRGEDQYFIEAHLHHAIALPMTDSLIVVRHGQNHTWRKIQRVPVEDYFRPYSRDANRSPTADSLEEILNRPAAWSAERI